jgi:HSP20 family protein
MKMSEKESQFDIFTTPFLYPKLFDDIEEKILSPLSYIRELETKWILEFDLPLVDKEDISITCDEGNIITVEAKLRETYCDLNMVPKCEFHYFKKKITLPGGIDEKKITSTFSNGRLTINVPKVFRGHKIKIE